MIRLFTGLPGAGKTAHFVAVALEYIQQGRAVFVANLNGMAIPGAEFLDDPTKWPDLPDGSVVMVDEAQKFWRGGRSSEPTPEILELETHRHRGFDFVLTTQHPSYLNTNLRRLVGEHVHHVRRTKAMAQTWKWDRVHDDPLGNSDQECADGGIYKYDPQVFGMYTSTVMDTHKPKLSWRMRFLIAGGLLVLGAIIFGPGMLKRMTLKMGADASAKVTGEGAPAEPGHRSGTLPPAATPKEWLMRQLPRVEMAPWSAPVFDDRKAMSEPELYCMSSEAGIDAQGDHVAATETCITEQGTPARVTKYYARMLARYGPSYNPYKKPAQPVEQMQQADMPVPMPVASVVAGTSTSFQSLPGYGGMGVGSAHGDASE